MPRSTDLRSPPADFDGTVEWFERIGTQLVLLEERPLAEVRASLVRFDGAVREHLRVFEPRVLSVVLSSPARADARAILRTDHAWFLTSLDQLDWFYRIVEREDHGGHRQALGQYCRVLAESLRRHRRDERAFLAGPTPALAGALS